MRVLAIRVPSPANTAYSKHPPSLKLRRDKSGSKPLDICQYSARTRGKLRKLSLHQDNQMQILEPLENNKPSKSWAALIKRFYEVDPLVCQMKIKAFIIDPLESSRLLNHLQIPTFITPSPIRVPPQEFVPDQDYLDHQKLNLD